MPSDIHSVPGNKCYVPCEDRMDLVRLVRERWPGAMCEGAVGSYSFYVRGETGLQVIVAEAWIHPRKPGWWLRIRTQEAA